MSGPANDDEGPRYPLTPGFQNTDTSKEAADAVAEHTNRMHRSIIGCLRDGEYTGDEMAAMLGWERHSIRPRLAELHKLGAIEDTGARRMNVASGRRAIVWRLVVDGQADSTRPTDTQAEAA